MTDQLTTGEIYLLPQALDLIGATPLRSELLQRRGRPLELDGSQVHRLGGLCLQVVLSARAAWAADDIAFHVTRPSQPLQDALAILGAQDVANDWQEETSR